MGPYAGSWLLYGKSAGGMCPGPGIRTPGAPRWVELFSPNGSEHALRTCGLIGAGTYCQNLLIRFGGTVLLPDALRQRVYQRFLRRGDAPEMPWAGTPEELTAAASQS